MAHHRQRRFVALIKAIFPDYFQECSIIDVGSADINGSVKYLFDKCLYIGVDLWPGRNVDVIYEGRWIGAKVDTVISCECLEHDKQWAETVQSMAYSARSMLLITCAGKGRPEHGTRRTSSARYSPVTTDYYMNLERSDLEPLLHLFPYRYFVERDTDLYFIGFKNKPVFRPSKLRYFVLLCKTFFYERFIDYRSLWEKFFG